MSDNYWLIKHKFGWTSDIIPKNIMYWCKDCDKPDLVKWELIPCMDNVSRYVCTVCAKNSWNPNTHKFDGPICYRKDLDYLEVFNDNWCPKCEKSHYNSELIKSNTGLAVCPHGLTIGNI